MMNILARTALCLSILTLSSCSTPKTDIGSLKPETGQHNSSLPIAGALAIYLDPKETTELYIVPGKNGQPYFHTTGEILRSVSVDISHKYFESASIFDPSVKASYVLKLSTKPDISPGLGVNVLVTGTLYTPNGKQIWTGTKHGVTTVMSLSDEFLFHNVYADAIKQLLDEALKRKYNSLAAIAKTSTPQSVTFKDSAVKLNTVSTGTGFFINDVGVIATNNHVVKRCLAITVRHNGNEYDAEPVGNDSDSDLALIKINTTGNKHARILPKNKNVRLGAKIHTLGYPLEGYASSSVNLTSGNISALSGPPESKNLIQITAPVQPGNSGGPVVDSVGTVVGMVQSKLNAFQLARRTGDIAQNVNFAVRVSPLRNLLIDSEVKYFENTTVQTKNMDTSDVAEQSAEYTVQLQCKG